MNLFRFIYKFILIDVSTKKFSFINLFPFFSQVLGIITILLTLTVMNGLEDSIFKRLKIFNLFYEVLADNINLETTLNKLDIDYIVASESNLIASNFSKYAPIKFKGIKNFYKFSINHISDFLIDSLDNSQSPSIFIGEKLSMKLNINTGEDLILINPNKLNFFTSTPKTIKLKVGGIFRTQILDIDENYVFTDYENYKLISNNDINSIFTLENIENHPIIGHEITVKSWKLNHSNFIKAYNNEKILYSSFGFIVIIISSITLSGIIAISIRRRLVHMSVLRALGYDKFFFIKIYSFFVSIFSIAASILSFVISLFLYWIDIKFGILEFLFPPYLYFPFEMSFSITTFISILFLVFFITLISTLFSISSVYKINIAENIKKI